MGHLSRTWAADRATPWAIPGGASRTRDYLGELRRELGDAAVPVPVEGLSGPAGWDAETGQLTVFEGPYQIILTTTGRFAGELNRASEPLRLCLLSAPVAEQGAPRSLELMKHHFRLAPMTIDVLVLTLVLLLVPVVILIAMLMLSLSLLVPLLLICLAYAWVWLRFRPSAFILDDEGLEVVWPLKRRRIRRADIRDVHLTDRLALRRDLGWRFRVGAGGVGVSAGARGVFRG
ncbi:hypothetical protein [Thiocapsa bogorovii]|uniref:hypothetical protein n=1 Tax=Thiocapsa bogorovii TaxID=521689 RepID=UPI001E375C6A|nr:hypothetical protein [Thiocapsa bogorovii]UHD16682.1 hypothetical protein LT988_01045 [Thiocapsa bogorovii]